MACACAEKTNLEDNFYAVFELTAKSESKFESIGSAFKLKDKIITNAHNVYYEEYGEKFIHDEIVIELYASSQSVVVQVEKIIYEKDIAILLPLNKSLDFDMVDNLSAGKSDALNIGCELYTIGNLNNYGLSCNKGILSSYQKMVRQNDYENYFFQTDIEISKGNSGGPVLDDNGLVVGVMTFKLRDMNLEYVDGASFFIPIETVLDYL